MILWCNTPIDRNFRMRMQIWDAPAYIARRTLILARRCECVAARGLGG